MTYEEHIAAAKTFLLAEALLNQSEFGMIAAEAIWGATVQVIDAVNHRIGERHAGNNRDREQLVEYLVIKYAANDIIAGFDGAKTYLHNHFYTGRLNGGELSHYLKIGAAFVNRMIEMSALEGSGS